MLTRRNNRSVHKDESMQCDTEKSRKASKLSFAPNGIPTAFVRNRQKIKKKQKCRIVKKPSSLSSTKPIFDPATSKNKVQRLDDITMRKEEKKRLERYKERRVVQPNDTSDDSDDSRGAVKEEVPVECFSDTDDEVLTTELVSEKVDRTAKLSHKYLADLRRRNVIKSSIGIDASRRATRKCKHSSVSDNIARCKRNPNANSSTCSDDTSSSEAGDDEIVGPRKLHKIPIREWGHIAVGTPLHECFGVYTPMSCEIIPKDFSLIPISNGQFFACDYEPIVDLHKETLFEDSYLKCILQPECNSTGVIIQKLQSKLELKKNAPKNEKDYILLVQELWKFFEKYTQMKRLGADVVGKINCLLNWMDDFAGQIFATTQSIKIWNMALFMSMLNNNLNVSRIVKTSLFCDAPSFWWLCYDAYLAASLDNFNEAMQCIINGMKIVTNKVGARDDVNKFAYKITAHICNSLQEAGLYDTAFVLLQEILGIRKGNNSKISEFVHECEFVLGKIIWCSPTIYHSHITGALAAFGYRLPALDACYIDVRREFNASADDKKPKSFDNKIEALVVRFTNAYANGNGMCENVYSLVDFIIMHVSREAYRLRDSTCLNAENRLCLLLRFIEVNFHKYADSIKHFGICIAFQKAAELFFTNRKTQQNPRALQVGTLQHVKRAIFMLEFGYSFEMASDSSQFSIYATVVLSLIKIMNSAQYTRSTLRLIFSGRRIIDSFVPIKTIRRDLNLEKFSAVVKRLSKAKEADALLNHGLLPPFELLQLLITHSHFVGLIKSPKSIEKLSEFARKAISKSGDQRFVLLLKEIIDIVKSYGKYSERIREILCSMETCENAFIIRSKIEFMAHASLPHFINFLSQLRQKHLQEVIDPNLNIVCSLNALVLAFARIFALRQRYRYADDGFTDASIFSKNDGSPYALIKEYIDVTRLQRSSVFACMLEKLINQTRSPKFERIKDKYEKYLSEADDVLKWHFFFR